MAKKPSAKNSKFKFSGIRLKSLLLPLIILITVVALGLLKNQFVAATINGEQINRIELIRELEKRQGKQALENLISQRLINQEAEKRNINISEEETNSEISKIEKRVKDEGQNLDDLLIMQGLSRKQLKEEIKRDIILRKLIGKVEVQEKEIDKYLEDNKEAIPQQEDMKPIRDQIKNQLEQEKMNEKAQKLIEDLRKKAKIEYLLPL